MPTPKKTLDRYRETLRRRDAAAQEWQEETRRQAWRDAQQAASLLKDDFGAERVVLFGSVAQRERLSSHSDLDLAVEGLTGMDYYRAVARIQSVPAQMTVDLVRMESCSPPLRTTIQDTGVEL